MGKKWGKYRADIRVRLPEDEYARMRAIAARLDVTVAEAMREAVARYIAADAAGTQPLLAVRADDRIDGVWCNGGAVVS